MTSCVRSPGSFASARCPAVTVTFEAGGAGTYTQRATPGSEPGQDSCTVSAYVAEDRVACSRPPVAAPHDPAESALACDPDRGWDNERRSRGRGVWSLSVP
jgi:hypothetical protein